MGNNIKDAFSSTAALTITMASLASSTAGVGRQSTMVDNTTTAYPTVEVGVKIKTTATTTANSVIFIYLIRDDGNANRDDGAGASDAALTVLNAQLIGTLTTGSTTSAQTLQGNIIVDRPGPKWGIAIVNSTGTALDSTAGNHLVEYTGINPIANQ